MEEKRASVYSSRKARVRHGREATVARACDDITAKVREQKQSLIGKWG